MRSVRNKRDRRILALAVAAVCCLTACAVQPVGSPGDAVSTPPLPPSSSTGQSASQAMAQPPKEETMEVTEDEQHYAMAVRALEDYYTRCYSGAQPSPVAQAERSAELDAYVAARVEQKQALLQASGGFVKQLELSFSQLPGEEAEQDAAQDVEQDAAAAISVNAQATFYYPGSSTRSGFGEGSVFVFSHSDGACRIIGWRMEKPADDFSFAADAA